MAEEYAWGDSFQQKLLALYVRDPKATYNIIEPAYFTNPVFQDISRLTKDLLQRHDNKDVRLTQHTLTAVVKGSLGKKRREIWPAYRKTVRQLFEDRLDDRSVVLDQAVQFARDQKFRQALVDAEKDVNNRQYIRAIRRFDDLKGFGITTDLGIEYWKDLRNVGRWRDERSGLIGTFYLRNLDYRMGGGLGAGELGVILGVGKGGKSTLLGRFAAGALWQGKNVALATGELSKEKYRKRIDAMVTGLPTFRLTQLARSEDTGNTKLQRLLHKAQKRMELAHKQMKGNLWIKQWPTNKGRISDIEAWLDQLKNSGINIDILFVDYIRVFKPTERYEEQRMNIGQVTLDLRGIAVERNIPVWTASQANRAALSKARLGPMDLAEDISQFWTLDFMVALCQTEEERGTEEQRKRGVPEKGRLYLVSARDVAQGFVDDVRINRDTFVVTEKESREK